MNKNFLIILFVTIFYNGVTHSTLIEERVSDVKLPEERPPTVAVDHMNKKIDPNVVSTSNISSPVFQNGSSVAQPVNEAPINNATPLPNSKTNTTNPPTVDSKNTTQDAGSKINTHTIDNNNDKSQNQTIDGKNTNQTADGKNLNQTTDNKNADKKGEDKNGTVPAPTKKNSTENSVTTSAGQNNTVSSTSPSTVSISTIATATTPVSKPTDATVGPTTSGKENVIAEQNTPAPAQEKHFDGPSFIGGIVLTIGLTAIGFIAFKYYKSGKIDMNYRTL